MRFVRVRALSDVCRFRVPGPPAKRLVLFLHIQEDAKKSIFSGELRPSDVTRHRSGVPHGHLSARFTHDAFHAVGYHRDRALVGARPAFAINDQSRLQADRCRQAGPRFASGKAQTGRSLEGLDTGCGGVFSLVVHSVVF